MALQVMELDHDPTALSLVATCLSVGLVAFVLVGGIAADRIPQRIIIIAVEAVNTVAVSAVAVLGLLDQLRIWHMAVAAALLGIGAAFFFPAYSAYLPRILPAEQLLAANGIEGAVRPVLQRAVGPAVAGVLVGATFPSLGAVTVAVAVRRRPRPAGGHPAGDQHLRRGRRRTSGRTCWPICGPVSLRGAHAVAAVDTAVRQHLRARRARTDRGAVAVHRRGPLRGRRPHVRLRAGGLRRRRGTGRARSVVTPAASALPDGDDAHVGAGLAAADRRRLDELVPADGGCDRSSSA